jgi:hypothetical protein
MIAKCAVSKLEAMQIEQNILVALPHLDIELSWCNRQFELHAVFMAIRP